MGKSVSEIIIEKFLSEVDKEGVMPWQRPYKRYNSFNYFSFKPYKGINRLLLPFGEYMTAYQINKYNEEKGEDFRFQKGIEWYPVVFFKVDTKSVSADEIEDKFPDFKKDSSKSSIGVNGVWSYFKTDDGYYKTRNILRYSMVADRQWFKNSRRESPVSRLESQKITLVSENPKKLMEDYIKRSGVGITRDSGETPHYNCNEDKVTLNSFMVSEEEYYSTAFHELAHSTGHASRLNRETTYLFGSEDYAVEECIAEITSYLLCSECGILNFSTSGTKAFENNKAYVKYWKEKIGDWGKKFIYIVSQADKAFHYILGDSENSESR